MKPTCQPASIVSAFIGITGCSDWSGNLGSGVTIASSSACSNQILAMNGEAQHLRQVREAKAEWKKWGPYLRTFLLAELPELGFRLIYLALAAALARAMRRLDDRAKQDERVVLRGRETSALPEVTGFVIDGVDHQCPSGNENGGLNTVLQGMFHQTCAKCHARPNLYPWQAGQDSEAKRARRVGRSDASRAPELTFTSRGDPDPRLVQLARLLGRQMARQNFDAQMKRRG
jgi:hypothetical protein